MKVLIATGSSTIEAAMEKFPFIKDDIHLDSDMEDEEEYSDNILEDNEKKVQEQKDE